MACTIKKSSTLVDVHGKSPSCRRRWSAKTPLIRQDDRLLRNYYVKYKGSWSRIAKELPGRDNRACYNRWINHANPDVNKQPLEKWEIDILKENYKYYGNQWNLVIKGLKGRTPLQAKNFFYSMRKSS
ncbi:716_t:CDS:2, partial [Paraglomus occultum]